MRIVVMRPLVPLAVCALVALTGCDAVWGAEQEAADGRMPVTAAFYPLQFAAERVGGEHVDVTLLTRPGTEPHDLELTPKAVVRLARARAVVYLSGFQPAVDAAVASQARNAAVDVRDAADLTLAAPDDGHDHAGETAEEHADHDDEGAKDPHFWLDPQRMAVVATAIGAAFAERDPVNAAAYLANARSLVADLDSLDGEFRRGLAGCANTDLVTSHAAFAYLAERYGLGQEGIAGISPDVEPSAATIRDLTHRVRETGAMTVYAESLASPALAETVARETGARVVLLDPLEGLTETSSGSDYLEVMRANLRTLREGQRCP
jgi:zinc transport system substrate-binding protein